MGKSRSASAFGMRSIWLFILPLQGGQQMDTWETLGMLTGNACHFDPVSQDSA